MQSMGRELLAGAALAVNEDASIGPGHQGQLLAERLHGYAVADDVRNTSGFAELIVFETEAAVVQSVARDQKHAVDGKRLFEKIVRAELGRLHGRLDCPVTGDHHHNGAVSLGDRLNTV